MDGLAAMFPTVSLWAGATILALAMAAGRTWPPWWMAERVIGATVLAVCAGLAPVLWPAMLAILAVPYGLLWLANARKSNLVKSPVTPVDVRMAMRNPAMLFDLVGLPRALGWMAIGFYAAIALAVVIAVVASGWRDSAAQLAARTVLVLVAVWYLTAYLRRSPASIQSHIDGNPFPFAQNVRDALLPAAWEERVAIWTPQFNTALARQLGPLTFLVYKRSLGWNLLALLKDVKTGPAVTASQIAEATPKHTASRIPPNIVVMQLESVCNPNWAFELMQLFECRLFQPNSFTKILVPLRVNTVGGGSWISEFEMITGLDTRLFGGDGTATHVTLPPYIRHALPSYLAERGYQTHAFYSAEGLFYNARAAYRGYGYQHFHDAHDLGVPPWRSSDIDMATALIQTLQAGGEGPLFAHTITNGAHSPLRRLKANAEETPVRFKHAGDADAAKLLTYYVRLLRQSEQAVFDVLEFLKAAETRTGRPFVLVAYGDHQPWEFTKGTADHPIHGARTANPANQTFAHVMASDGKIAFDKELPLTLLPSITSLFIEPDPRKLYLPMNFHLYAQTGADLFGTLSAPRPDVTMMKNGPEPADAARRLAERQAAAWIANSGYLKLPES